MLPFYERCPYKLKVPVNGGQDDLIAFTNISDVDMTIFSLAKKGYGSIEYIGSMDSKEFLDLVEFEKISADLERHAYDEAKA